MANLKLTVVCIATSLLNLGLFAKDKPATIIKQEIIIDASIEDTWQVLGPEFADAYKWAASIKHSEAKNSESLNGSSCTVRGCSVSGIGDIKEKILLYSEAEHTLKYQVHEGMPKMVRYAANTWELIDLGNKKTKLVMHLEMKTGGFMGWLMRGMMKKKMTKLSANTIEEFKYYVENGKPHPRKLKANKKLKRV